MLQSAITTTHVTISLVIIRIVNSGSDVIFDSLLIKLFALLLLGLLKSNLGLLGVDIPADWPSSAYIALRLRPGFEFRLHLS